jgi:hypothetical protein
MDSSQKVKFTWQIYTWRNVQHPWPYENTNLKYTKTPSHPSQIGSSQRKQQVLVRVQGKKKPSCIVGGNVNLCNHHGNQNGGSSKN